uniref:Uncharacterized protein n=1 Tax=Cacopsylla melanoneura TaxID=428564 RepID=A0A8D9F8R6_9HEMI
MDRKFETGFIFTKINLDFCLILKLPAGLSYFSGRLFSAGPRILGSRLSGSCLVSRLSGSCLGSRLLGSCLGSRLSGSCLGSRLSGSCLGSRLSGSCSLGSRGCWSRLDLPTLSLSSLGFLGRYSGSRSLEYFFSSGSNFPLDLTGLGV